MNEGFYKLDDGSLLYAPNFVSGPGFELLSDQHENYSYPVDGWGWFGGEEEARKEFGMDAKDYK